MKVDVTLTVTLDIPSNDVVVVENIYKELTSKLYVGQPYHPDDMFSVESINFDSVGKVR